MPETHSPEFVDYFASPRETHCPNEKLAISMPNVNTGKNCPARTKRVMVLSGYNGPDISSILVIMAHGSGTVLLSTENLLDISETTPDIIEQIFLVTSEKRSMWTFQRACSPVERP